MHKQYNLTLQLIPTNLLEAYCAQVDDSIQAQFEALCDSPISAASFSFYTSVSAVFSSKIEGEDIELDAYVKHKSLGAHFLPNYTRKTDDLYATYTFAQQNKLSEDTLLQAHAILTSNILQTAQRGKVRTGDMFVLSDDGRIEYVAALPASLKSELELFYSDLQMLLNTDLSFKEVLFFAALIHLVFVKVHPFEDGNGRTARLLEKWFIAQKLGAKAWFIQSEKHYYTNHQAYYTNLRRLGLEYAELDYNKSTPFLLMLPASISQQAQ